MFVVSVKMQARAEKVDQLIALAKFNSENSRKEPGNLRFDVLRSSEDPLRFRLYEAYRDEAAFLAHQQTAHYARWKAEVAGLLAAPRKSGKYLRLFPETEA